MFVWPSYRREVGIVRFFGAHLEIGKWALCVSCSGDALIVISREIERSQLYEQFEET